MTKKDIWDLITGIKLSFISIVEKNYSTVNDKSSGSILDPQMVKLKKNALESVNSLCSSIAYKLDLVSHRLQAIKTFDWSILHNFDYHKSQSQEAKVKQNLYEGKLIISCAEKEIMEDYIFSEISAFFSNISGIIDNISIILRECYRLDVSELALFKNVYAKLEKGKLKDFLHKYVVSDYNFGGMRIVRKACEHRDLTQIFPYSKHAGLGSRYLDLGKPFVNCEGIKFDNSEDSKIDAYCDSLFNKVCEFLRGLANVLSELASIKE